MNASVYSEVAEDFIAMMDEIGDFGILFGSRLIRRSRELPTDATPDRLLTEVLEDLVRTNFAKLSSFRVSRYMQWREVPMIVEALKPLCGRAFVTLNELLSMERDYLFPSNAYVQVMGRVYDEDAPSVTFVQFLNTAERLKAIHSAKYEQFLPYIIEVHALNRVAEVMPRKFHQGRSGKLAEGQSYDAMKQAEVASLRDASGIHTWSDLLERAGVA